MAIDMPDTAYSAESSVEADYGVAVDQTDDGATKLRDLYGNQHYTLRIIWTLRSQAQHDALMAFLLTNRIAQINITLYGKTYITQLAGRPNVTWPDPINAKISAVFRGPISA